MEHKDGVQGKSCKGVNEFIFLKDLRKLRGRVRMCLPVYYVSFINARQCNILFFRVEIPVNCLAQLGLTILHCTFVLVRRTTLFCDRLAEVIW